jgi:hypothetical protein
MPASMIDKRHPTTSDFGINESIIKMSPATLISEKNIFMSSRTS